MNASSTAAAAEKETASVAELRPPESRRMPGRVICLSAEEFRGRPYAKAEEAGEGFSTCTASGTRHAVRRTVRSGIAFDLDSVPPADPETAERIARVKAELGDEPIVGLEGRPVYRFVKRAFDIVFSAAVLVAFSWLYLLIAILVKVDDPKGPVFFKQERVGKDGKTFKMWKFRSMCVDAEERLADLKEMNEKDGPVFKIVDDPRITRVGRVIRKLSLDELPQFANVLVGGMSVVGPRPALPAEVEVYTPRQRKRLLVRPGITCYWQTRRNRDSISFDEWMDLDLLYIKKCGSWTDLKLIIQTVGCVFTAQGN